MKKSTLIALAVFGALALAWLLSREPQVNAGVHHLNLEPLAFEAVTGIELSGANTLTLQALDGGWTVGAFTADARQAQGLARAVTDLKSPEFVTEKVERQAELELDAAKGVTVKVRTATGVARELVVGKNSKTGGTYLRLAGSNEVYSTPVGLSSQVRRPLADFRDRRITTAKADEVTRLKVEPASGPAFALVKEASNWKLEGSAPAGFLFDAEAAQRLVSQATSVVATDFIDSKTEPNEKGTTLSLELSGGAPPRVLHVGEPRPDGNSTLRIDGEAQVWVIAGWQAKPLLAGLEGLRDLKLLRADSKDVEKVTVYAAKGKTKGVAARDGSGWKLVEPKTLPAGLEFDPQQVDAQLSRLLSLRAVRVAEVPAAKAAFSAPAVELQLKGGAKVALLFGAETGTPNERYAKGSDGLVLVASSANQSWLEGGVEVFKKQPPPPQMGGMGGMQGLEQLPPDLRAKLEAQLRAQQPGQ